MHTRRAAKATHECVTNQSYRPQSSGRRGSSAAALRTCLEGLAHWRIASPPIVPRSISASCGVGAKCARGCFRLLYAAPVELRPSCRSRPRRSEICAPPPPKPPQLLLCDDCRRVCVWSAVTQGGKLTKKNLTQKSIRAVWHKKRAAWGQLSCS